MSNASTKGLTAGDISSLIEIREDNREKVKNSIRTGLMRGLEKVGMLAEGYAKRKCPVDTGRLRNSITHNISGKDVYIGTNVEYAYFVEFGSMGRKPKHFLIPAATEHADQYKRVIQNEISK